jgi:hypothetical protein
LASDVRLMAVEHVRSFCRKQKNGFSHAQAIAEAVTRPTLRCAGLKAPERLDLQALHRVREQLIVACCHDAHGATVQKADATPCKA